MRIIASVEDSVTPQIGPQVVCGGQGEVERAEQDGVKKIRRKFVHALKISWTVSWVGTTGMDRYVPVQTGFLNLASS